MRFRKNILPPLVATLLFVLALLLTFPYYKYYIDPDAVAYLSIIQRYAAGQWQLAVNGLWSPLHPFLAGLLVRMGTSPLLAAHLTNALAGIGVLYAACALFRRFRLSGFQIWLLMACLPFTLVYFHYIQLFADLWMLFFILLYLLFTTRADFAFRKRNWIAAALFAACAFYAKAYAFYFVLLHVTIVILILYYQKLVSKHQAFKAWLVTIFLLVALVAPWSFLMHAKYQRWTLSNAGALNTTWFLTGQKQFRQDIKVLVPPPYKGSLTDWEDPWESRGPLHRPFESTAMLKRQMLLSGRAVLQLVAACNEISPLLIAALLMTLFAACSRQDTFRLDYQETVLLWTAFLFPLGYLTLFVETRYVWLLSYIAIIFGMKWLDHAGKYLSLALSRLSMVLFVFSFLAGPAYGMSELLFRQRDAWIDAAALKQKGIKGSFVSNYPKLEREWVLAWLTGNPNYTLLPFPYTSNELVAAMQRCRVRYFFDYGKQSCALPGFRLVDSTSSMHIYEQTNY